ncbi:hypothetical protein AQJ67_25255 [Streptomyces caeruleatus]|uniref:Uncharacterized protein n=1 Tax=Streptomyces caeruleatus TaxID=661399 RepID=A0A101TWC1_9ACTN|nr:hypothetical protein AQJ67_25255 [Streptomyces caeruleatus]
MPGTVLLLAAAPAGKGCLVDAASVLPVLAAVPPTVLSGTDTANVVELADPLEPQAVLTRLRAAAASPAPLTVFVTGQLHLDRRQHLPHLALARTTPSTVRYTGFPWHWFREELRLRVPGSTSLVLDLHADAETWEWLGANPLDSGRNSAVYGRIAPPPSRRTVAGPAYMKAVATLLRSGHRPSLDQLHQQALTRISREGGVGTDIVLTAYAPPQIPPRLPTPPRGFDPGPHQSSAPLPASIPASIPGYGPPPGLAQPPLPPQAAVPGPTPSPAPAAAPGSLPLPAENPAPGSTPLPAPVTATAPTPSPAPGDGQSAEPIPVPDPAQSAEPIPVPDPAQRAEPTPAQASMPLPAENPAPASAPLPAQHVSPSSMLSPAQVAAPSPAPSPAPGAEPTPAADVPPTLAPVPEPTPESAVTLVLPVPGREAVPELPPLPAHPPASTPVSAPDPHATIAAAVESGRHGEAEVLAAHFEQGALRAHGPASEEALHWIEVRADLAMMAGDPVRSCRAWLMVASARLSAGQAVDAPAVEAAVDRAHHQWGQIKDAAPARELGPALAELRGRVPGRRRGALENVMRQLQQLQTQV